MKVVLFCGGLGMRLREYSETIPKPMVPIGNHPILWHVMKYYAHYGYTDFILCLGYKAHVIKEYFLNYNECLSNDFTLSDGGKNLQLLSSDIQNWRITFVDTGLTANIGQRLKAVEPYLDSDPVFLANYTDGLTDLPLPCVLDHFYRANTIAGFLAVRPSQTFHRVRIDSGGLVRGISDMSTADFWINGGFFVFKREIFAYLRDGEELVHEPFQRLIAESQLTAYKHAGFWACMDTFKEKQQFDDMHALGHVPWEVWRPISTLVG
ncbi:MAG: Nucleoside-diphosphate-sugar pyrophosphorylase family protein [Chloroflexi bacterium]|nr:Nucleoside-diphosphate-sugar pyrophosphorylase family protein [Chloroflexota bacterium]